LGHKAQLEHRDLKGCKAFKGYKAFKAQLELKERMALLTIKEIPE
jgi:hypothetical protein